MKILSWTLKYRNNSLGYLKNEKMVISPQAHFGNNQ